MRINNAAQTVRRPPGFYRHLLEGEQRQVGQLPGISQPLLEGHTRVLGFDGPGVGTLVAALPGAEPVALAGSALLASWSVAAGSCADIPWRVSCEPVARPIEFYSRGVTNRPLRVDVVRVKGCNGFQMERRQASPTRVEIADARVINLAGSLVSVSPGQTSYRLFYEGTECTSASLNGAPCAWNASVHAVPSRFGHDVGVAGLKLLSETTATAMRARRALRGRAARRRAAN